MGHEALKECVPGHLGYKVPKASSTCPAPRPHAPSSDHRHACRGSPHAVTAPLRPAAAPVYHPYSHHQLHLIMPRPLSLSIMREKGRPKGSCLSETYCFYLVHAGYLYSSTCQIDMSTICGICWVVSVTKPHETAQVEPKSGRV